MYHGRVSRLSGIFSYFWSMKTLTFPLLVAALLLITAACKKQYSNRPPVPSNDGTILFETTIDDDNTVNKETYYYNTDNLITKIIDTTYAKLVPSERRPFVSLEYQWDNNKELSGMLYYSAQGVLDPVTSISKQNNHGKVWHISYSNTNPFPPITDHWLGFDNQNRVATDTTFNSNTGSIVQIVNYTYDVNGNIVQRDEFNPSGAGAYIYTSSTAYTYDQKVNPLYNSGIYATSAALTVYSVPFLTFCRNNMLTQTATSKLSGNTVQLRNYTYEYNKSNMPVKRTLNRPGYYEVSTYQYK